MWRGPWPAFSWTTGGVFAGNLPVFEPPWFRRAALLDSRLSQSGPHALDLILPFSGEETADELEALLAGLGRMKES